VDRSVVRKWIWIWIWTRQFVYRLASAGLEGAHGAERLLGRQYWWPD
jgi:hypothetical protein